MAAGVTAMDEMAAGEAATDEMAMREMAAATPPAQTRRRRHNGMAASKAGAPMADAATRPGGAIPIGAMTAADSPGAAAMPAAHRRSSRASSLRA
jgi:hypothetical protein